MSPPSEEDWKQIEHRFNTKWNFPSCIGSLNGKHIMMRCPPNSHSLYYNYKGFFSIVLMALVDADYHLFTSMLATMDQMGTVVSLSTVPLEKLLLVNSWIYQDQRDCQDTQRGVPYSTALWQMRHSPSGWISCDPTPVAKRRTGWPMINLFLTTISVGLGGL